MVGDENNGKETRLMQTLAPTKPYTETFDETETSSEKDKCAHIVKTPKGETATALVLRARIEGNTLEALCGFKWVPSRDPQELPVCEECKSIWQSYKEFNGWDSDGPNV